MEVSISIIHPEIILVATMETIGDAIAGRFCIYTKISVDTMASIEIDCYWSDISTWERDIRHNLNPVINGKEGVVEIRIRCPRYTEATATERRIREVLNQVIGINDR